MKVVLIGLLLTFAALLVSAAIPASQTNLDVLVIEHTPVGVVERTGVVVHLQVNGPSVLLEFADDGDQIFHNGFEQVTP